jgi:single-stranded DNA-specific DHH superfamily exonuclease
MKQENQNINGWLGIGMALMLFGIGCQPQESPSNAPSPEAGELSYMAAYQELQNRLAQDQSAGVEALASRMVEVAPTDALREKAQAVANAEGIDQVRERLKALSAETISAIDAGELEVAGTELRDASEFSTLLNATARYDRADVGLAVCLGDRGAALDRARTLLRNHRKNLSEGLELVKSEGTTVEEHLQWFDAGTRIRETIVGIVAGMALGADGVRCDLPIVAFASVEADGEDEVKVSARGSHALVRQGLDLSVVMREAARSVGGDGGGHDVAAGATIPADERAAFVAAADELVADQLGDGSG